MKIKVCERRHIKIEVHERIKNARLKGKKEGRFGEGRREGGREGGKDRQTEGRREGGREGREDMMDGKTRA